jgi:dephospho-CoA kinase
MSDPSPLHNPPARAFRVGLTGGIGTGKSVVAEVFGSRGAFVLDADAIGHDLMQPGNPAYEEIVREFGKEFLDAGGRIDRKKLGERIFASHPSRMRLNAILHPRILGEVDRRIAEFASRSPGGIAVVQAALIVETGTAARFDCIVATECDTATQVSRLVARDGLSEAQARRRIGTQAGSEARRSLAHHLVDTSGSLEETRERARQVFDALKKEWWDRIESSEEKP